VYGLLRRRAYQKKADQRELLKVIQANFRKFMSLRNWGWFIIINKTKPLIGQTNIEEELRLLEEKAKEAYGAYEEALNVTKELEEVCYVINLHYFYQKFKSLKFALTLLVHLFC